MRSPAGVASSTDTKPSRATSAQHAFKILVPIRARRREAVQHHADPGEAIGIGQHGAGGDGYAIAARQPKYGAVPQEQQPIFDRLIPTSLRRKRDAIANMMVSEPLELP